MQCLLCSTYWSTSTKTGSGFSFLTANGSMYVLLEYVSLPRSSDVPECPRVACINSTYSIVGNETANLHSLGLGKITGLGSCFSKGVRVLPAPCTSDIVLRVGLCLEVLYYLFFIFVKWRVGVGWFKVSWFLH